MEQTGDSDNLLASDEPGCRRMMLLVYLVLGPLGLVVVLWLLMWSLPYLAAALMVIVSLSLAAFRAVQKAVTRKRSG